jgi:hypothetical protein
MTFGTNVVGQLIRILSKVATGYPEAPIRRTLLFHGAAPPRVIQNVHLREQATGREPHLANGTHGRIGLWFWAGFLNLQGLTEEEEDVGHRVV